MRDSIVSGLHGSTDWVRKTRGLGHVFANMRICSLSPLALSSVRARMGLDVVSQF